jgi:hypothetical protein
MGFIERTHFIVAPVIELGADLAMMEFKASTFTYRRQDRP